MQEDIEISCNWPHNIEIESTTDNLVLNPNQDLQVNLSICYCLPGAYNAVMQVLSKANKQIIARYLISIVCKDPIVTKTEEYSCTSGKEVGYVLSYVNQFSESKLLKFVSSDEMIVKIKISEELFQAQQEKPISMIVNAPKGTMDCYIFIYDQLHAIVSTIRLIIKSL